MVRFAFLSAFLAWPRNETAGTNRIENDLMTAMFFWVFPLPFP